MDSIIKHNKAAGLYGESHSQKMETVIKKQKVTVASQSVKLSDLTEHTDCEPPVVNLRKNSDILESIEIICPCGRKIEVLCEYD